MRLTKLLVAGMLATALPIDAVREDSSMVKQMARPTAALPVEGVTPPLSGATEWLNSPPLTTTGLRGKVVLIDFWTYTCVNWLRTLPYIRAWADKYKARGLVVIGVHSPEFSFEGNLENVRRAATDMMIGYAIASR
jgi:thiol-disulfide isomerase/thioredoxin